MRKVSTFERVARRWLRERVRADYHLYEYASAVYVIAYSNRATAYSIPLRPACSGD